MGSPTFAKQAADHLADAEAGGRVLDC